MRLAGNIEDISCLILGYSPESKQLLVKSPDQENMTFLADIDCGSSPIFSNSPWIKVRDLREAIKNKKLTLNSGLGESAISPDFYLVGEWQVTQRGQRHVSVKRHQFDTNDNLMEMCGGLDLRRSMVAVNLKVFNCEDISNKQPLGSDYSLDALIQFVQDINEKYAARHVCASLRIKGPKFIQMFFDGICVLKNGEKIDDVGYEEVSRRIAHVAECI